MTPDDEDRLRSVERLFSESAKRSRAQIAGLSREVARLSNLLEEREADVADLKAWKESALQALSRREQENGAKDREVFSLKARIDALHRSNELARADLEHARREADECREYKKEAELSRFRSASLAKAEGSILELTSRLHAAQSLATDARREAHNWRSLAEERWKRIIQLASYLRRRKGGKK